MSWHTVAQGHGIMAAILETPLPAAIAMWDSVTSGLGHSGAETLVWHTVITSAYCTRRADLNRSVVEREARRRAA